MQDAQSRARVKAVIDTALTDADDAADSAAVTAADVELTAGAKTVPAEQLWRELNLEDHADARP